MFDTSQVPNSIVNENSVSFKDSVTPYPYITFAEFFNAYNSTDILNAYNEYVVLWSDVKNTNNSPDTLKTTIRQKYIDLLNDINLQYTNEDEKRFLVNLNLQTDADLLIPFYINKIANITEYFIKKRDDIKFTIQKNKNSNSKLGIATQLKNYIIDQLTQNDEYTNIDQYTIDTLQENLEVDILEKFDTYSHNYDVDPSTHAEQYDVKNELYKKYFTNNILDYNKLAFNDINTYLLDAIKQYPLFIKEFGFGFSINNDGSNISSLKSKDFINCINTNDINDLNAHTYMQLTTKYAGVDMHYLSTSEVSGILFAADAPYTNKLNVKHTTIPSVPACNFVDERTCGAFFLPSNQELATYATYNKSYDFKNDIDSNTVYVYPDPKVCGNIYGTSILNLSSYPFSWKTNIDGTYYNKFFTNVAGIITNNIYKDFHGYDTDIQDCTLNHGFETIYNQGTIYTYKSDIYGNEYALFKQKPIISPTLTTATYANYVSGLDNINNEINTSQWLWIFDGGYIRTGESEITSDYKQWPDYVSGGYFYDILLDAGHASGITTEGKYKGFPRRAYFLSDDKEDPAEPDRKAVLYNDSNNIIDDDPLTPYIVNSNIIYPISNTITNTTPLIWMQGDNAANPIISYTPSNRLRITADSSTKYDVVIKMILPRSLNANESVIFAFNGDGVQTASPTVDAGFLVGCGHGTGYECDVYKATDTNYNGSGKILCNGTHTIITGRSADYIILRIRQGGQFPVILGATYTFPKFNVTLANTTYDITDIDWISGMYEYDGGTLYTDGYVEGATYYSNTPYIANSKTQYHTIVSPIIENANGVENGIYNKRNQFGTAMMKYQNSNEVLALTNVFNFIPNIDKLNISNIDIIQDIVIIQHSSGIIFNKIFINKNGVISKSSTPVKVFNNTSTELLSRHFYIEKTNSIILVKFTKLLDYNINNTTVDMFIPTVYIIDVDSLNVLELYNIFDVEPDGIVSFKNAIDYKYFIVPNNLLKYISHTDQPILTYNSLNNVFNVACMIHDWLDFPHLVNVSFVNKQHSAEILSNTIYHTNTNYSFVEK